MPIYLKQLDGVTSSDIDADNRTISNVTDPTTDDQAVNKGYADGIVSAPTTLNKAANPSASAGDGSSTGIAISSTPAHDSYVKVDVNGIAYELGDGVKTKDCYFSGDSGSTARAISAIVATDVLYWNGVIAGVELLTTDEVNLYYETSTTPTSGPPPDDQFVSSSTVNMSVDYRYWYCDTTSNAITMNLPAISSSTRQIIFDIKLDNKPGSNNVTIVPNGSDTIEESSSFVISTEKVSITIRCPSTGTDWKLH